MQVHLSQLYYLLVSIYYTGLASSYIYSRHKPSPFGTCPFKTAHENYGSTECVLYWETKSGKTFT